MPAKPAEGKFADYEPARICEERHRLMDDFLEAVRELNMIQSFQTQAVIDGDHDFARFDPMIYAAQEKKDSAKYAWMAHIESHLCEEDLCP
jgi:hypothetical protein